ncbi:MAG: NADPH-dependent FMN reductase [Minisyncoccia bacterium]
MNIIAFSGSLREKSFNSALLRELKKLAAPEHEIEIEIIGDFPLYNQDQEAEYPATAKRLKDKIVAADAVVIVTPEYNRSVPGVLKNAIDWVSRPYGTNPFAHKPVLIMGVSGGKIGTAIAQSHLREILEYLDADTVGQPELYFGPAADLFNGDLELKEESTKELLRKALTALTAKKRV